MTVTAQTTSPLPFQNTNQSGCAAVAISAQEYGYIRLLSAVSGQPKEVLLADYLAQRVRNSRS